MLARVGGTCGEILTPLVLLVSTDEPVTLLAVCLMVASHAFVAVMFPLAAPLEGNVLFGFLAVFLCVDHPAGAGYGPGDLSSPWLLLIGLGLLRFPVLGNLRPDLVSFLASMRPYAGNGACCTWAFTPGAEAKLKRLGVPVDDMTGQRRALLKYEEPTAELAMSLVCGWRSMHSQGRGPLPVLLSRLDDVDTRTALVPG